MEWNARRKDPLPTYLEAFDELIGDRRKKRTFAETMRGRIGD